MESDGTMMKRMHGVLGLLLAVIFIGGVMTSPASAGNVYVAGALAGESFYKDGSVVAFEAVLYQDGESFWGDCVDADGSSSKITGTITGNALSFFKTYDGDNHRVQYAGDLIPETNTVTGHWRMDPNNINTGTFKMTIRGNKM
ncbi:MAG TPA: hypothetical protein VN611_11495 [Patescibacteria group bacterium]|nr:hypothetical protein [Patescibacteria group bacterium]